MHTPEEIKELKPDEIFVFGSNLAGLHIGGAAKIAKEKFGAKEGVGEGITGQSYAFPTLGKNFETRSNEDLKISVSGFFECAKDNHNKAFLLTRVGCGIAGYDEEYMKSLFYGSPNNVVKPEGWE